MARSHGAAACPLTFHFFSGCKLLPMNLFFRASCPPRGSFVDRQPVEPALAALMVL